MDPIQNVLKGDNQKSFSYRFQRNVHDITIDNLDIICHLNLTLDQTAKVWP